MARGHRRRPRGAAPEEPLPEDSTEPKGRRNTAQLRRKVLLGAALAWALAITAVVLVRGDDARAPLADAVGLAVRIGGPAECVRGLPDTAALDGADPDDPRRELRRHPGRERPPAPA